MTDQDKINQLLEQQKKLEVEKNELAQSFSSMGKTLNDWMEKQS